MIAVPHPLASAALWRPHHPLLIADDGIWPAQALADAAARLAASWRAHGVTAGDIVAVVGEPTAAFALALHAVGWLGATALPLAAALPPSELSRRMHVAGARFAVGAVAVAIDEALPPDVVALSTDGEGHAPLQERFWSLHERRVIIATSGTSGTPKLVSLTTAQLAFSAFGSLLRLGHDPADRWLGSLPIDHIGGLSVLLRSLWYGTTAVLHRRFDAARVAAALDGGDVTRVSLTPALLARVLAARPARAFPRALRAILVGGAAADKALLARCRAIAAPVALSWGMSEAGSQIATAEPGEIDGTAGAPLAFARVDAPLGLLRVRGPLVGGELVSADRGAVEHGRVIVHGRADAVINSGGVKIDPLALEARLREHPSVAEALVAPVADAHLGEIPGVLLVARGEAATLASLREHCAQTLPRGMHPRRVLWVPELPLDTNGKPSRQRAVALLTDTGATQALSEVGGSRPRPERTAVDERMLEANRGAQATVVATDSIAEGRGAFAESQERQLDAQPVAQARRNVEIGLGVHERHAPVGLREEPLHVTEGHAEHLLERGVAVLEEASEEGNAGPVDLEETHRHSVLKRHRLHPLAKEEP